MPDTICIGGMELAEGDARDFIRDWYADGGAISEIALLVPSMLEREIAAICLGEEWLLRHAPNPPLKRGRRGGRPPVRVIVDGTEHPSIYAAAMVAGVRVSSLTSAINSGRAEYRGLSIALADPEAERERLERRREREERRRLSPRKGGKPPVPVIVDGVEHPSMGEGARAAGIGLSALAQAISVGRTECRGLSIALADPEAERERLKRRDPSAGHGGRPPVPVILDGAEHGSISAAGRAGRISPATLKLALSKGWTEVHGMSIALADPDAERERLRKPEAPRKPESARRKRRGNGGRRSVIKVVIDDEVHEDAKAGAAATGLNPSTLRCALWEGRRTLKGHSIALADAERERARLERAAKTEDAADRRGVAVLVDDEEYGSVAEGAGANGVKPMTLASALHRGSRTCQGHAIAYVDPDRERERLERAEAERAKRTRPWKSAVVIDGAEHDSVAEGSRAVGVTRSALLAALSRGSMTTGGHSIAYADPGRERERLERAAGRAVPVPHPRLCEWPERASAELSA